MMSTVLHDVPDVDSDYAIKIIIQNIIINYDKKMFNAGVTVMTAIRSMQQTTAEAVALGLINNYDTYDTFFFHT